MRTRATSVREAVRDAARRLREAGVPEPEASSQILMAELLGVPRGEVLVREEPLSPEAAGRYEAWISRRLRREPVQRILGYAYFRNLKLYLNEDTLIPRPDTESVVEAALERIDARGHPCRVLDVGTGSGAIAIAVAQERPACEVHATDISQRALDAARRNAALNGTAVSFHLADLAAGLHLPGKVDLLVSNPPYVDLRGAERRLAPEVREWDPPVALYSGEDEYAFFRRIFDETPPLLKEGADVVLEVGDGQWERVMELGEARGFRPLGTRRDLAGDIRAVLLRWEGAR
ncbi:release factor glutamine methyltransferase [Rubrobacter xylanophilus]|uniref:Release factor glutamine methyltransferase n=1 Tax=Rubrobacter xylanophilus TaxID=49319 RepID=A0A510HGS1_9ACTN|nr:peptide chain release factor N(5)-glutamine methyltransferase [Rubrobacter xylanophilus]BBL79134.1 release factor glutamine methyltransferase [Rubrobacter xylanophilus]